MLSDWTDKILLKNITNIDKVNCLQDMRKLVKYPQADILILPISLGYYIEVRFIGFISQKASFKRKCAWMILNFRRLSSVDPGF